MKEISGYKTRMLKCYVFVILLYGMEDWMKFYYKSTEIRKF